jgi:hypothetical protein
MKLRSRGEKALPDPIRIVNGHFATHKWMLGADFSLVDCDYGPVFDVLDKAGFDLGVFGHVHAYLDAIRAARMAGNPQVAGTLRRSPREDDSLERLSITGWKPVLHRLEACAWSFYIFKRRQRQSSEQQRAECRIVGAIRSVR